LTLWQLTKDDEIPEPSRTGKILYGFAGDGEGTVVNKQPAGELEIP